MSEVFEKILTLLIILSLIFIVYSKATGRTLGEIISDIKEHASDRTEEVVE